MSTRSGSQDTNGDFALAPSLSRRHFAHGATMAAASLSASVAAVQAAGTKRRIHRHDAAQPFPVNAYIVEGDDGLGMVDATLTVSSAAALRRKVETLGKPIRAVLLTHSHPNHYAGIGVLTAGWNVPIVALAGVDEVVRRDDAAKDAISNLLLGAEWPRNRVFASQRVRDGDRVDYGGGLAFTVMDIGPAESLHDSVWVLESERPIAFSGDLVYPLTHRYTADGQIDRWRRATERLQSELAEETVLYGGHGPPTTPALLSWQRLLSQPFRGGAADRRLARPRRRGGKCCDYHARLCAERAAPLRPRILDQTQCATAWSALIPCAADDEKHAVPSIPKTRR